MTASPYIDTRTGADARGYYIRTFTGLQFHWDDIEGNGVNIIDIAHALAMNCRWTGHVKTFYSVAQHCVYASLCVPPEHALAALLHDASEAYIHDTPSPLKWHLKDKGFTAFADLEKRVDKLICGQYGLTLPRDPSVKEADLRLLATENRDLMPAGEERLYMVPPYKWHIKAVPPAEAEDLYLRRFYNLQGE